VTLTHAQIKAEVQELKQLLAEDKVEIPGFWQCYGPGAGLMLFSAIWSVVLIILAQSTTREMEAFVSVPVNVFFAFGITVITGSNLSLFYSLPLAFRQKSVVVALIGKRIKYACGCYIVIVCIGCFFSFRYIEPMLFFPALIVGYLLIMMVIGMDLSRYQLSAFTSVLHAVKNGKDDPVSPAL